MPEECKSGNHKDLVGKFHEHRHMGFRTSNEFLTEKIHDRAGNYSVGFDRWFRFRTIKANRLLEKADLPSLIHDTDAVRIMFLSYHYISLSPKSFVNIVYTQQCTEKV